MDITIIERSTQDHGAFTKEAVTGFLFKHLEQYGDPLADIQKCYDYAMETGPGGFVTVAHEGDQIYGAVIMNETGMKDYIPENILVYIAVDAAARGKGVGKKLMEAACGNAKGAVALHVEPDNPAKHLYEKVGFTNKYLEMRLAK